MAWLRDLERMLEERLEGGGGIGDLHALEATRRAVRMMLDRRQRCGKLTLVPNRFQVPFPDHSQVPPGFLEEVRAQVAAEVDQRGFRVLAPVEVCPAAPDEGLEDVEPGWTTTKGRPAVGFVEGVEGPAGGGLWGIPPEGIVLGRGAEADVRLVDPGLSRVHLKISVDDRGLVLEDLESHNGTRLGRKKLEEPTPVKTGTRVGAGESVIRVWTLR